MLATSERPTARISADEWFARGERRGYEPAHSSILGRRPTGQPQDQLQVFERVVCQQALASDARWTTMLPGFPDGSYGYAQVNELLGRDVQPRLFIEYIGQGDSDKPAGYQYSTIERADLVEAQWQVHGVHTTFVVTFDYSSLVLLELLARQYERATKGIANHTRIAAVFIINGGLFADSHSHPWQTTPLLKSQVGQLVLWAAQRSPTIFANVMRSAAMYSKAYNVSDAELRDMHNTVARRDGASFVHRAAGFVDEQQRNSARWDLRRLYVALHNTVTFHFAGSEDDPFEPRQLIAVRERLGVDGVDVRMFPGGHMTTSEHPDLLANAIRDLWV